MAWRAERCGHPEGLWPLGRPHAGALLLWESDDEASLRELIPADPFAVVGVIRQTDVYEWTPVFGPFVP